MTRVTTTSFRPQEGSVLLASGNLKADATLDVDRAKSDGALLNKHMREDFLYQTPRLQDTAVKTTWDRLQDERTDCSLRRTCRGSPWV